MVICGLREEREAGPGFELNAGGALVLVRIETGGTGDTGFTL